MKTFAQLAAPSRQWLRGGANQLLVLLLVLAAFPLFWDLGRNPVQLWDESRQAVNAAELARGGNWLVTTFAGQPDHWNTKPPLLIWLQAGLIKLLGYGPWALRLPSAVAGLGTVGLLYGFAARALRRPVAGFFGGLVLVTTAGYVRLHGTRTGDYDALLAFWELVSWLAFFQYLEGGRARYLYWVAAGFTLAVLTKGVAGLLGGPALLLYALGRGKLGGLLRQPRLYGLAALGLGVVATYYLARETADPGYLAAVRANELDGRYGQALDGHNGPWTHYVDIMYVREFESWLWWLLPAVLVWWQPDRRVRRAGSLLLLVVLSWLLLISSAATKLDWYALPIYPPLALLLGLGLDFLYHDVLAANLPRLPRSMAWPLRVGLVVGLFYFPYRAVVRRLREERDFSANSDDRLARYLGQVVVERPQLDSLTLLYGGGYNAVLQYYQTALRQTDHKIIAVRARAELRGLRPGAVVLVCDPQLRPALDSAFRVVVLHQASPCETLRLLAPKQE